MSSTIPLPSMATELVLSTATTLLLSFRQCFHRSRPTPPPPNENAHCLLLRQPLELILSIGDYLNPYERTLLAQTCRPLRSILHQHRFTTTHPTTAVDRLQYMYMVARDRLDVWACMRCHCLHRVAIEDVPGFYERHSSLVSHMHDGDWSRKKITYKSGYVLQHTLTNQSHVQLALKYWRLYDLCSSYEWAYLERLLQPYRSSEHYAGLKFRKNANFFVPKIASLYGELVYLVFSAVDMGRYTYGDDFVQLPYGQICLHLQNPEYMGIEPSDLHRATSEAFAEIDAIEAKGDDPRSMAVRHGSCPYCLTDFTVAMSSTDRVRVGIWTCLGTEAPADSIWMEQCSYRSERSLTREELNLKPGSIRELYGHGGPTEFELF